MANSFVGGLVRKIKCLSALAVGRRHWALGPTEPHRARARDAFQRLARLEPSSFSAHLYLGALAILDHDRDGAIREFGACFRIDRERFDRAAVPEEVRDTIMWRESLADALGLGWASNRQKDNVETPAERRIVVGRATQNQRPSPDSETPVAPSFARTKFAGDDEFRRLRDLPPITDDDIATIDWDDALSRLAEDS